MSENTEQITEIEEVAQQETGAETKQPMATLLGSISYENHKDYENFLNGLTLEHAAIVLISAANYAHTKGAFSLDESELIAKAIKRMTTKPENDSASNTEPQTEK
jgi:hypothetical protein